MSDNKKYYYLKLKDDFFDNDEIKVLEKMDNGYKYSNILLKMYLKSIKRDGLLMFNERIPYNEKMIATVTGHNVNDVIQALVLFQEMGMVEKLSDGAIYMLDIQNFIGKSTTEADRIRSYRNKIEEKKDALVSGNVVPYIEDCTNVQQMYDKCTPEIEIEIDIEKEIDTEKKKKSAKKTYGQFENVKLTDEEYDKLKERYVDYEDRIEELSIGMDSKGYKYKNHYSTILSWARKEEKQKPVQTERKTRVVEESDENWLI